MIIYLIWIFIYLYYNCRQGWVI